MGPGMTTRRQPVHTWLAHRLFFPLALASMLAMALYCGQRFLGGGWHGPRLHLNLFLAWLPYVFVLWAMRVHERHPGYSKRLLLPAVLWLLFFPNAPYLVTDYMYVAKFQGDPWTDLWLLISTFTAFAICGLLLAVVSLHFMHALVRTLFGPRAGRYFVAVSLLLAGLGVYLGRFLRLNSWNVLTRPGEVFANAVEILCKPRGHVGAIGFSLLLAALLGIVYYAFAKARRSPLAREEREG